MKPTFSSQVPDNLTLEVVEAAVKSQMFGLENPGFCMACGAEHDHCEPDASGYKCYSCGENKVEGAQNVFMMMV